MTGPRYADMPTAEVHTWIAATPGAVWTLVTDIALMPTLSDELYAVEWVAPARGPAVGAAFRGHNRQGGEQWSTTSYVIDCDPPRIFGWAVGDLEKPGAIWKFILCDDRGGTLLIQWVQLGPGRSGVSMAVAAHPEQEQAIVAGRLRSFTRSMSHNLKMIKTMAENS